MGTLHRHLIITFLTAAIFNCAGTVIARAEISATEPVAALTVEEKEWLKHNPHIRFATLTNQPPFSMLDAGGSHTGMLADFLALISDAIGQKIDTELVKGAVSDPHKVAKGAGNYGSASILTTARHGKDYLLTEPYFMTPFYIYAKATTPNAIRRPADLRGKRVAAPRHHRAAAAYLDSIGSVKIIFADTPLEQMQKVVSGEADALIGYFNYPFLINKYLMVDLMMVFVAKSDQGVCIGVNPEHPILRGILNKAIATFDDSKVNAIMAKWTRASREQARKVNLTKEEEAWLAAHPEIVLGTTTEYAPMVIKRADGKYIGLLVELYEQVNRQLNTRIHLHIEDPWAEVLKKAQKREIDGLAMGGRSPNRKTLYNSTDVIIPTYFSVFARSKNEFRLKSFADLKGMRIGYKRAAEATRSLLEKLPAATLQPYDNHEIMTQALLQKEIDVIVAWMSYDHWRKDKLQGTIDNILLIDEYPIEMVTFIRKDWPELITILNKTIAALQQHELPRIINKWFGQMPLMPATPKVSMTSEERAWFDKNHTVRVRIADWPPYMIVKANEQLQGIVIEYLRLIGERTGITFKPEVTDQPFAEFLQNMKQRRGPDMTAVIVPTPERGQYLTFSKTYISSPYVIFMREQDKPILDITGLVGRTLAVPQGFVVQQQLVRDYPDIRLALFDSDEDALEAVATGQADAYIGNLTVASHIIHKRGFSSLQVAAASPFKEQILAMGNRKDWPELTTIIDKALTNITEEEKTAIRNKYLAIKFEQGINKTEVLKWTLIVGVAALGIIFTFMFWNRRLHQEIRKRKQTEMDLMRVSQAKSSFLANMSHELRTPLNAILGFSGMLARERSATADQQAKLQIINRSGGHLLDMINDILDLSKIEAGRAEFRADVFDLHRTLEDIGSAFKFRAKGADLRFTLDFDAKLPRYVIGDGLKLSQVLSNLLSNAVKYTDNGGIVLRAHSMSAPDDPAMVRLQLAVEDSGQGISPEQQEQIFEPFFQAGNTQVGSTGTGLGLAISRSYVKMMNGRIAVKSIPGKGSQFKVDLPVVLAAAEEMADAEAARLKVVGLRPDQPAWRILVAEDNRENRLLMTDLLRGTGFEVREASNGQDAIDIFEQWQPHLIWMDMRMPVTDGYAATAKIRTLPGGDAVKIVAITASAFKEQRPDILASGCNEVVYKPFRDHEVFEAMARVLGIKYLYEDKSEGVSRKESIDLTAEMLADLPGEFLLELRAATSALNRDAAFEAIARIADQAPEVAAGFRKLLNNYQMAELSDLLEKSGTEHA